MENNIYNKNKLSLNQRRIQRKKDINNIKQKYFSPKTNKYKSFWIFIGITIFTFFALFLVVSVDQNGFNNIVKIWSVNKNLIYIILISSFSLGIASFLIQQMTNNRLADTSALGIGNINLIVLILLIFILDFNSTYAVSNYTYVLPFAFIIFSVLASLGIYYLSYKKNVAFNKKFILAGILLNFVFIAIAYSFNSFLPSGKSAVVKQYINGFYDNSLDYYIYITFAFFVLAIIWIFSLNQKFKVCFSSNYEIAKELGINVNSVYLQTLVICGILTAVSFILVGNVIFLGIVGANLASFLFKRNYKYAIPASGYISAIIVAITFMLVKNISQSNVNTSQLIPLISLPCFIYLLIRSK